MPQVSHIAASGRFSPEEHAKMQEEERRHFPCPPPSATIWKYYKPEFFKKLIESRALYLRQVCRFPDDAEARMNAVQLASLEEAYGDNPDTVINLKSFHERIRQRSWVTCFSVTDFEAAHMWTRFCGKSEGVAIKTSFQKLALALSTDTPLKNEIYPALVRYVVSEYMPQKIGYLLFQKLPCFSDERELRLCICRPEEQFDMDECTRDHIDYPVHLLPMVNQIRVHPAASDGYFQEVRKLVAKHLPDRESRVRWSVLRR